MLSVNSNYKIFLTNKTKQKCGKRVDKNIQVPIYMFFFQIMFNQ